jgi:hypothetical protein
MCVRMAWNMAIPSVSRQKLTNQDLSSQAGKLSAFSIERPMRFLLLLGRDIEITVKGKSKSRSTARLRVA